MTRPSLLRIFDRRQPTSALKIIVPPQLDWTGYHRLIGTTRTLLEDGRFYNRIVMDLSGLRVVTSTGLAMLASVMLLMQSRGTFTTGRYLVPRDDATNEYLRKLGFYDAVGNPNSGLDRIAQTMRQYGGLVHVTGESQCDEVAHLLAEFACTKQGSNSALMGALQFCLAELLNNVFNHAKSDLGAVACAQASLHDGRVEIAVMDSGIGILASLKSNPLIARDVKDEQNALALAVQCEVTSKPRTNTGIGLFFTRKIAVRTGGEMLLHSGARRLTFKHIRYAQEPTAFWRGTCATVRLGLSPISLPDIFRTYQTEADRVFEI